MLYKGHELKEVTDGVRILRKGREIEAVVSLERARRLVDVWVEAFKRWGVPQ